MVEVFKMQRASEMFRFKWVQGCCGGHVLGTVIKFRLTKRTENILHFANISERHASEVSVLLALEAMYIFSRFAKDG